MLHACKRPSSLPSQTFLSASDRQAFKPTSCVFSVHTFQQLKFHYCNLVQRLSIRTPRDQLDILEYKINQTIVLI